MRIIKISGLLIAMFCICIAANATSPALALQNAKNKIKSASSITADFKLTINGQTTKGKLISKSNKFTLSSGISTTWYNGRDMWTYIPSTNETTVIKPSVSELVESNPLLYIDTTDSYTITASKVAKQGYETVVLLPKRKNTGLKSVTLMLNNKTWLPSKITVKPSSGNEVVIVLDNIKLNSKIADSTFEYNKAKYPRAKIIDVR